MSRRETRDSDSRYHRSRFDREPSPKRVRRDGKPATERPNSNLNMDSAERNDRDQKYRRRLQDSLPLESLAPGPKVGTGPLSKESDKKSNGYREGTKNSNDNTEAPRSLSHFQHDERAGQVGRSFRGRETNEREWWKDAKDRQSGRAPNRTSNHNDTKPRDEKTGPDHRAWRQDTSYKTEPDSKQSSKKRPSFRETKVPSDSRTHTKPSTEATEPSRMESEKMERGKPPEKPPVMRFQSRDRYGGNGGGAGWYRGRDRFSGRQVQQSGGRVEKWKHDLYDEANKSPTSKNEEEQIAKVEALLAS